MNADFTVLLDACVLVPASLRGTVLRLAEKGLFLPRWSDEIIEEMERTIRQKLKKTPEQTAHLTGQLRAHFSEAWVDDYRSTVPLCTNHEKDRHVLAAAVRCDADLIVTFNLRHFGPADLAPWGMEVAHPDDFLIDIFRLDPDLVAQTLHEQAGDIGRSLKEQLRVLNQGLPKFVQLVATALHL